MHACPRMSDDRCHLFCARTKIPSAANFSPNHERLAVVPSPHADLGAESWRVSLTGTFWLSIDSDNKNIGTEKVLGGTAFALPPLLSFDILCGPLQFFVCRPRASIQRKEANSSHVNQKLGTCCSSLNGVDGYCILELLRGL